MTTEIDAVRPQALHDDVPYAYATVAPAGRLVLTAGACPIDADGTVVATLRVANCGGLDVTLVVRARHESGWSFTVDDPELVPEVLSQARALAAAGRPVLVNAILGKTDFRKGSISM